MKKKILLAKILSVSLFITFILFLFNTTQNSIAAVRIHSPLNTVHKENMSSDSNAGSINDNIATNSNVEVKINKSKLTSEYKLRNTYTGIVSGQFGDNLTWKLEEGTLTISGSGVMPNWNSSIYDKKPWYKYYDNIETIIIEDGITNVGSYAFDLTRNLINVTLPNSVTDIGDGAFYISTLNNIKLSDNLINIGDSAFRGCNHLMNIELPDSLISIGNSAFISCDDLINIEIPDSVTNIGNRAFSSCVNLANIKLSKSMTTINSYTFYGCTGLTNIEIPDNITNIEGYVFDECSNLTNIKLSKNITTINSYTFYGCTGLTNIEIPDNVVKIKEYAFKGCSSLKSIKLSKNMTNININTFAGCTGLTDIEIPDNITNIEGYAFDGCSSLKSIKLSKGMTTINSNTFTGCTGLTNIEIPDNITNIKDYAFYGCDNLASVKLSKNMTTINSYTFAGCTGLTNIEIPDNIMNIESYAFRGCINLTNIKLSKNMTTINSYTFTGCTGLTNIEIPDNITNIKEYAFNETAISSVIIPESVVYLGQMSFPEKAKIIYKRIENLTSIPLKLTNNTNFIKTTNKYTLSSTINSYLYEGENKTFYRVEYTSDQVFIEQYNSDYTFIKSWSVPIELPKFGGFYAGNNALYIVFGQNNEEESDDTEVIRIVKYSKDMERLDSISLYGMNTSIPFRSSSLRIDENENYLFIRTGHRMYKTSDGLNHQANMTIIVNTEGMILSYCGFSVSYPIGYVSHSFNQFVKIDGDTVITVDHGDAYPRGIVMHAFSANNVLNVPNIEILLLSIPGKIGNNYTGVSIGGFEFSDTSYLVAGNSIDLDKFTTSKTRNIFLSVVDKDDLTSKPEYIQVTNYEEGGMYSASTPQLIKISDNLFAVMWEENTLISSDSAYLSEKNENGTIKIAFFDGEGKSLDKGNIGSFKGCLSDCQPIILNNCVTWYVADDNNLIFYSYPAKYPDSIDDIKTSRVILKQDNSGSSSGSGSSSSSGGGSGSSSSSGGGSGSSSGSGSGSGSSSGGSRGGSGSRSVRSNSSGNTSSGSTNLQTTGTYLYEGTWQLNGQYWNLLTNNNQLAISQWAFINGKWYVFDKIAHMLIGWQNVDNYWYYMNLDGSMATGWIFVNNKWYYLKENGVMATGWICVNSKWYYLGADGSMYVSTITPDGYEVNENGEWIINGIIQIQ